MSEKKPTKGKRPVLTLGEKKSEKKNSSSQGGNNSRGNIFDEPNTIKIIRSNFFRTLIYGTIIIFFSVLFSKNQTKVSVDSNQIIQEQTEDIRKKIEKSYPSLKFIISSSSEDIKIEFQKKLEVDQFLSLQSLLKEPSIVIKAEKDSFNLNLTEDFFSNYKIPGRSKFNWSIFAMITSCLLMIFYHFKSRKYINTPTSKEVFADSFYYLGFLFTFITLLFVVSTGTDNSESMIQNMGVALATTVLGLAFRIYLTQFNPIVNEPEEDIQKNLATLASSIVDISSNLQNQLAKVSKDLGQAGSILNQQINTVDLNQFNKTLNPFKTNLNSLNIELDKIRNDTSRITSEINNSAQSLNSITSSLDRIKNVADNSEEVLEEIKRTNTKINDNQTISNENLETINNKIQSVEESLEKNKKTIENSSFQVQASTKQFTEASGKMVEDTLKIQTSMKEKLLDLFNFLKK